MIIAVIVLWLITFSLPLRCGFEPLTHLRTPLGCIVAFRNDEGELVCKKVSRKQKIDLMEVLIDACLQIMLGQFLEVDTSRFPSREPAPDKDCYLSRTHPLPVDSPLDQLWKSWVSKKG